MIIRRKGAKRARALAALALAAALCAGAAGAASPGPQKKKKLPDDKNPQVQYDRGLIALRYGLTDEAVRYGQLAISLDAGHFDGWNLLGSAYYARGDHARSAEAFEKAVALKPEAADAQKGLGLAYVELKEPGKAEAALKKAWEVGKGWEAAYYLARLYYNGQRYAEALDYALKSIQDNGKNAGVYNLKGVVLNQLGRYAEAAGSFQAGLVLAPGDVNLQVNLGIALLNSGQSAKALAAFETVLPKIEADVLRKQVEDYIKAIKDAGK